MKVLFVAPSPKAGQTEHLDNMRAQGLIDAGFAVEVPRAPRGTPEWHKEMAELEAERVKNIPAQRPVPEWTLRTIEGPPRKFVVVKSSLVGEFFYGETLLLDRGRPDFKASAKNFVWLLKREGCPENVIQQWQNARNAPDYLAQEQARIAEDKRNAEAQREREKAAPRYL